MVEEVSLVSVRLAMSMRRSVPSFCSMLPDASRMISMAPDLSPAVSVTATLPGSFFAGVTVIGERASVWYVSAVE